MADDLMYKISALGKKVTSRMSCVSFKMKEFFSHGQSQEEKMVKEATSEALPGPDWSSNLDICDAINTDDVNATGVIVRSIKRRIAAKNPRVQYLALVLLETCVKNCEEASFSEVADAEGVVDEVIGLIEDPRTVLDNARKALCLIEAWGGYQETFKGLKSRGIRFPRLDTKSFAPKYMPLRSMLDSASYDAEFRQETHQDVVVQGFTDEEKKEAFDVARDNIQLLSTVLPSSQQDALKDNLTSTLVHQCRRCQLTIHKIIETTSGGGTNDCVSVLSEALNLSDELEKILMKYEISRLRPPMVLPVAVEPGKSRLDDDDVMDELDKMIFGKKGWSSADLLHS